MDKIPKYNNGRLTFARQIGSGYHGKVFTLGRDNKVGKFYRSEGSFVSRERALQQIQHEHDVCQDLFRSGVSVPESFGAYEFKLWRINHPWELVRPLHLTGWLREYIPGETIEKLSDRERKIAERLRNLELDKAIILGYRPVDAWVSKNTIVKSNNDVVLIDFSDWIKLKEN